MRCAGRQDRRRRAADHPGIGPGGNRDAAGHRSACRCGRAWKRWPRWSGPSYNYTFALDLIPNDPYYASYQASYLNRMKLSAAWDLTTGRSEIVLAVLDTGVDMNHNDLRDARSGSIPGKHLATAWTTTATDSIDDVNGWDFAGNDNVPDDDYGHGTHVAGIAAAHQQRGRHRRCRWRGDDHAGGCLQRWDRHLRGSHPCHHLRHRQRRARDQHESRRLKL